MLIIVLALLSCINAVDPLGKMIGSAAETFQQSVRVSANHPNAPVIASIPEVRGIRPPTNLLFNHSNQPVLTFRKAINGHSIKESKIIKYFASKYYNDPKLQKETYQDIINYITRDLEKNEISDFHRILNLELFLNNAKETRTVNLDLYDLNKIFRFGKLDLLKYLVGKENFHQFKDFRYIPYTLAAQNGHIQMVKWILEKNPSLESYKRMIGTSIHQNQKPTFTAILDMLTKKKPKMLMNIYSEALGYSLCHKRRDYVDYVLKKASDSFKDSKSSSQWSENFLRMYSHQKTNPTVSALDYFFSHKAWNPRNVRIILSAMEKAPDDVVERIGMELLNPRLRFDDSQGSDPLQQAITMTTSKNQATYGRVKQVLENIQKKVSGDVGTAAKKPRLENPVHLDGFGSFHPLK